MTAPSPQHRPGRRTGWAGIGFVALLFVSAGMASVPGGYDSTRTVRDFYTGSTGIIVAAQVLGLLAAACFAAFAWLLSGADATRHGRPIRISGWAVAAAAVVTAVPVLWLCAVADGASSAELHRWATLSDLTDVLLFTTIAVFAAAVARVAVASWLRWLCWAVAAVTLARAVLLLAGSTVLEVVAPLAFVVAVLAISLRSLLRPGHLE
jgi:hypothetical protein